MRSGRKASSLLLPSEVDSKSGVGKDSKIDPRVIDELLAKEVSLSPRKAKKSSVVAPSEKVVGGTSRNNQSVESVGGTSPIDQSEEPLLGLEDSKDGEKVVVESVASDKDVSELANQEFALKEKLVETTTLLESVAEKSKGETMNESVLEEDDVVNFQTDNTAEKLVDAEEEEEEEEEEEKANMDAEVETVNANESIKGLIIVGKWGSACVFGGGCVRAS